ncbi:E3 ubiquitin-protein ligase RNF146 [Bombina bombina]|uniref:E3 ubiquitin-protein ligase RNF146 n=1 Tax=Bombina bombina TaxID=8345 RepID=UPI00235A64F6|nr:E3 ubiquitin-protein ligase RNF146 [Bombina bombina]
MATLFPLISFCSTKARTENKLTTPLNSFFFYSFPCGAQLDVISSHMTRKRRKLLTGPESQSSNKRLERSKSGEGSWMAGCGEVSHSANMLPTNKKLGEPCSNGSPSLTVPECSICLQTCVHPVSLPCKHIFCFLCVKGASWLGRRCALCRQEIPEDFLEKPTLLSPEELKSASRGNGEYAWYYEGRNGWWQYDERTSRELEDAFAKGKKSTEMLIAGFLYVADLENMVQYRRNEHGRRRKIKRDILDIPKKGVAGLRLDCDAASANPTRESSADGADNMVANGAASGLPSAVLPARPHTSLGAQPTNLVVLPSDGGTPLDNTFSQLQIGDNITGRNNIGEGEEELPQSGVIVIAPETEVDEPESDDSIDNGTVPLHQNSFLVQQRHSLASSSQAAPDHVGAAAGGAQSTIVRARRPDGQCTVTEV